MCSQTTTNFRNTLVRCENWEKVKWRVSEELYEIRKWWNDTINSTCHVTTEVVKWEHTREWGSMGTDFQSGRVHDNKKWTIPSRDTICSTMSPKLHLFWWRVFRFFSIWCEILHFGWGTVRVGKFMNSEKKSVNRSGGPVRCKSMGSPGFLRERPRPYYIPSRVSRNQKWRFQQLFQLFQLFQEGRQMEWNENHGYYKLLKWNELKYTFFMKISWKFHEEICP